MKPHILLLLPLCLTACRKADDASTASSVRTVVVYMAADNDLWADALADDVEEMRAGFSEQRQLVEAEETLSPAAQGKVSNPPNTEATRQGEAPEGHHGSGLPP